MTNPFHPSVYLGKAAPKAETIPEFNLNVFNATKTTSVTNNTSTTVYLIDRQNIPLCFPRAEMVLEDDFKVVTTYSFRRQQSILPALSYLKKFALSHPGAQMQDKQIIMDALQALTDRSVNAHIAAISVIRNISTTSAFTIRRARFYLSCVDMVVDTQPDPVLSVHPYSSLGGPILKAMTCGDDEINSLSIEIDLVDTNKEFSTRFLCLGGEVLETKPIQDNSRDNGVHLRVKQHGEENLPSVVTIDKTLSCAEAENSRLLAKTKEQAVGYADTIQQRKIAIDQERHELEQRRLMLENKRIALDRERMDTESRRQDEAARREREREQYKAEAQARELEAKAKHEEFMASLARIKEEARIKTVESGTKALQDMISQMNRIDRINRFKF